MPTGYTAAIIDKDGCTFEEFVWKCARGFGACIMQKDEPSNSPIKLTEEQTYRTKQLEDSRKKLADLENMSDDEKMAYGNEAKQADIATNLEGLKEKKQNRIRYEAMLKRVKSWKPPSQDHQRLKDFMIEQITESMDFDCDETHYQRRLDKSQQSASLDYYFEAVKTARDNIKYHAQKLQEQTKIANGRTSWKLQLIESVGPPPQGLV